MEFSHIIDEFAKDNDLKITPTSVEGIDVSYIVASDALYSILKSYWFKPKK